MAYHRQIATRKGGPEVLEWQVFEPDPVGPGQLGIQVQAAGVLLGDVLWQMGRVPLGPRPPCTPG